ncbi:MAG: hypothetical protein AAF465_06900 [Pseudomonadota bacterium]
MFRSISTLPREPRGDQPFGYGILALFMLCLTACVSEPTPPTAPAKPVAAFGQPHTSAPPELDQFGRFAGRWRCGVNERRPDGSWRTRPDDILWTFFYTLNGLAVQDIWTPEGQDLLAEGIATNLRVFNAQTGTWNVSWTNTVQASFELWSGGVAGDEMLLSSVRDNRPVRIRFYNILPRQFQWTYEAATSVSGTAFAPVMQLLCQRMD